MKNKTKKSIVLALMMIVSTLTVGTVNADPECCEENLTVEKHVWDDATGGWVDYIEADLDDIVRFKITIDYDNVSSNGYQAEDIVVIDTLPHCLNYSNDVVITHGETTHTDPSESYIDGKTVYWNLTEDYEIILSIEPSGEDIVTIEYNATVVDCGENINYVEVTALEHCSGTDLYGIANATVYVECDDPCEPEIEVEKTVWNGTAWTEYVDGLRKGDYVDFKIEMFYEDCDTEYDILNIIVKDTLPCCLEFYETLDIYSDAAYMDDPTEEVSSDGKIVYWNWTWGEAIILAGGDSLTIEFRTVFVNYCEGDSENLAEIWAWGCSGPEFYDSDIAVVNCDEPEKEFDKKVLVENEWVDEVNTTVDETLRFKLSILYYGDEEYDIFHFKDQLPCVLEYADNAMAYVKDDGEVLYSMPIEGDLQSDNKTVWFNFTYVENFTLSDGLEISVEFDALVTGMSKCGCDCEKEYINKAWLFIFECGEEEPVYEFYDELVVSSEGNCPPDAPDVTGDSSGYVGEELTFRTTLTDPDNDMISYEIDFSDGSHMYGALVASGTEVEFSSSFGEPGVYYVKAQATDEHGAVSDWTTYPWKVTITEEEEPEEDIDISIPNMFYFNNVGAKIKNNAGAVTDVYWEFTISGGLLGKTIESNETIPTLTSGATEEILSGDVKMTFGMRTIDIAVTVDSQTFSESFSCFVLGRIVLIM